MALSRGAAHCVFSLALALRLATPRPAIAQPSAQPSTEPSGPRAAPQPTAEPTDSGAARGKFPAPAPPPATSTPEENSDASGDEKKSSQVPAGLERPELRDFVEAEYPEAAKQAGVEAELIVSQDEPVDAIRLLVNDDPTIKVLVLASGEGRGGPGPLVSRIGKGRPLADRPIAVTVGPGGLSDAQLDEVGGMVG